MKVKYRGVFMVTAIILSVLKVCGVAIPIGWWWIALISIGDFIVVGGIILLLSIIATIRGK